MKLTTKGKFAVTALLDMALHEHSSIKGNNSSHRSAAAIHPMTLVNISKHQGISLSYLEQLFVKLRRSGLVKSYKGPGGGYVLASALHLIKISDIIKAVDDDMDARTCHGMQNCKNNQKCLTHDLWSDLTTHIYDYLDGITLYSLVHKAVPVNFNFGNNANNNPPA